MGKREALKRRLVDAKRAFNHVQISNAQLNVRFVMKTRPVVHWRSFHKQTEYGVARRLTGLFDHLMQKRDDGTVEMTLEPIRSNAVSGKVGSRFVHQRLHGCVRPAHAFDPAFRGQI